MSTKTQVLTSIKGTPLYMAPELIEEHPYDHNADLWSFGCVVYQMIQGLPPFQTDSILHLIELIRFESIKWSRFHVVSQKCKSFLQGLLQKNPSQRLTWPALLEHPFLEKSLLKVSNISTPFATPVPVSQATENQPQFLDVDMNLTDSQAKFLRDTVPTAYGGRTLETMIERKRVPPLTSIPESKSLFCKHDGPFRVSLAHNMFVDHSESCQSVEQRQVQNREVEEMMNSNRCVEPEDDTSSFEQLVVSPETEAVYYQRNESYTGRDYSPGDGDVVSHNNKLPDWNPKAVESPIETEEWIAFLQKSMEEIMNGELDSLLQENCVSVLISPLRNLTVNCRVVKYIACLLSLPLALPLKRPTVFKIQRVYLGVKVVPNLVYALKLLMSERSEPHEPYEKLEPTNAKTKLASKLTSDELQTLEYTILVLCSLAHAQQKFLTQFCNAIYTVNGFEFLRQLLLLKKKKTRIVADLIAIFNHILRSLPKKARLIEDVILFPSMSWHADKLFVQLVTHSEEVLIRRTCHLIRLLAIHLRTSVTCFWSGTLRNALERLIISDPDQTVRLVNQQPPVRSVVCEESNGQRRTSSRPAFAMSLAYAILLASLFLLAYFFVRNRRRMRRLPPGPWQLPILGYLPWIDAEKPHESLTKLARTYGPVCGLRMGSVYTVLLSDPRIIKQAFAMDACAGRAPLYLTHGIMQGYGLVCAEGNRWRDQRKFVSICLRNFGMVKHDGPKRDRLEKRILDAANECVSKLEQRSTDGPIDPLDTLHHCMGNLVNSIVFGKTYGENEQVWKWLRHLQEEGVKHIGIAGPLNFLPILRFLPRYGQTIRHILDGKEKTHRVYRGILDEHRARTAPTTPGNESFLAAFDEQMRKENMDDSYFTESQLYHLLADLFGAGTDTTLTTLRWFLLFIAVHPDEQEKLRLEMDRCLDAGEEPTLKDRDSMPRLEAALAEVQRLRSVAPLGIPHGTSEDTQIGEYDVPKGAMIVPVQWAVHTDPAYWQDPLEYRPERFLAEDGTFFKPESFLPFQTGKRVCVGEELARMILFLFAARILRALNISVPSNETVDLEGDCGITLVPKPHRLMFVARHR
ncbi:cytochrome P450 enzyme phantom isoform X2 [Colletes latitarsis]